MVIIVLSVATNDVDVAIPESAPAPQSTKKWSGLTQNSMKRNRCCRNETCADPYGIRT